MRVLVFGDSITQGYWAVDHGWVDRVRMFYDTAQSKDLNHSDEPTIFNLGVSADNSSNILARIQPEVEARTRPTHTTKPVVVLQVGVNDTCTQPVDPQVTAEQYADNLKAIVAKVRPLASRIVFVGFASCDESQTTPVAWGDFCYTNHAIKSYEDIMNRVATEEGVDFIPIFDQFKQRLDTGESLLADGLHPNEAGHEFMYSLIKPKLQELLA